MNALWYVSRGTGVVALVLLTLVVVLGVLIRDGRPLPGVPRFVVTGLHRNASLMATVLLVIHVVTIVSDPYAKLGWVDTVIPFVADYSPFWMGLGTVGLELVLAVVITSLVRGLLGQRIWKFVHWFSYVAWPISLGHSLGSGPDLGEGWMVGVAVVCILTAVGAVGYRLSHGFGGMGVNS